MTALSVQHDKVYLEAVQDGNVDLHQRLIFPKRGSLSCVQSHLVSNILQYPDIFHVKQQNDTHGNYCKKLPPRVYYATLLCSYYAKAFITNLRTVRCMTNIHIIQEIQS